MFRVTDSTNNGLIGWINEKSISEAYLKQINTLKIGQKSNPIIQGKDMIIIKLNDKRVNERKVSNTRVDISCELKVGF